MEKQEKETIYRFCADKSEPISIFTCDENFAAKLTKLGLVPKRIEKVDGRDCSWQFYAPRNWLVKIRPKRIMSESEAQTRGKALMAARARKQQGQNEPERKVE